jgi:hypothetical protein
MLRYVFTKRAFSTQQHQAAKKNKRRKSIGRAYRDQSQKNLDFKLNALGLWAGGAGGAGGGALQQQRRAAAGYAADATTEGEEDESALSAGGFKVCWRMLHVC